MNRAGDAENCGAEPHFASRYSLSSAAIEVLENRCLLSGAHDYIWREAENFDNAAMAADLHRWDAFSYAGFNGSGVRAMENDKGKYEFSGAVSSARLDYQADFAQAGKYYVWVRGIGFDGNSDSVHLGLDSTPQVSAGNIAVRREGVLWSTYSSENSLAGFLMIPTAGAHTINLFMREAGTSIDQIFLTTDKAFKPANAPAVPAVTVATNTPTNGTSAEGDTNGVTYTFTRSSGAGENWLTVTGVIIGGDASANDYTLVGDGVTYNAGIGAFSIQFGIENFQAQITVQATSDAAVEGEEYVVLELNEPTGSSPAYHLGGSTQLHTTIFDQTVILESIMVTDPANPSNTVVNESGEAEPNFYINAGENQKATIDLSGLVAAADSSLWSRAIWRIEGDHASVPAGDFAAGSTPIELTVVNNGYVWHVLAGVDNNLDGVLQAGEVNCRIMVVLVYVDLDVDSDRDNGIGMPSRNAPEDDLEAADGEGGKLLAVNDDDRDGDGIPDYADGFDAFDDTDPDTAILVPGRDATPPSLAEQGGFVPIVIEISNSLDLSKATFQFDYDASDPAGTVRSGAGTVNEPYVYALAPGKLRLWTKDGTIPRNKNNIQDGGDFIGAVSGFDSYVAGDWSRIGITSTNRTQTLWVEAVGFSSSIGDLTISFRVDPDGDAGTLGFVAVDEVQLTAVDVDVMIGADNAEDDSLHDDWVGADDTQEQGTSHTIYNWLKLQGPSGWEQQLTVSKITTAGGGDVILQGYGIDGSLRPPGSVTGTLTIGESGIDTGEFIIRGGNVSGTLDDVRLHASFNGQVFGVETLTVLRFGYEEEVGSEPILGPTGMVDGNYVLNPAVRRNPRQVFAFDVGNASVPNALDARRRTALHHAGTVPALMTTTGKSLSRKLDPRKIEVTFGRRIAGSSAGSVLAQVTTDGTADVSQLSVAPRGINGSLIQSNLRFMDTATTGTGVDGNTFSYYLGHPTSRISRIPDVEDNFAKKVEIVTKADLTYVLNMTLLQFAPPGAPMQTTGLSPADVQRIVTEASGLWEQVGVRFTLGTSVTVTTTVASEWDLPNDDASTLTSVTTKSRANGLDVFVVNSLGIGGGQYLAGAAAYENRWGIGDNETGVLVARRKTSPTSQPEDLSAIARTLAHEIGHLIQNSAEHDPRSWHLMRDGDTGSTDNSDLTIQDREVSITPTSYNADETW